MVHKGRNDQWLIAAFALTITALLAAENYWIGAPLLLIFALSLFPQTYETSPQGLRIRAGLVRRWIPYETIRFVGPCKGGRNLALVLDGVTVQYGRNSEIRIAPSDSAAFLRDVACRAPHLVRRGSHLTAIPFAPVTNA